MPPETHNIQYESRQEEPFEITEMEAFIEELADCGLTALVSKLFYDSNANICTIETDQHDNAALWRIAEKHISQFEIGGVVGHGDHLFDSAPSVEEQEIDNEQPVIAISEDPMTRTVERGRIGEEALANWFSRHSLSYLSICQNPETFARLFTGTLKRPDFFLLFDSLGLIAVDAKNVRLHKDKYFALPLEDELRRAVAFERIFRMPLWYAFYSTDCWYWISALKAVEVGKQLQNKSTKEVFLSICKDDFIRIVAGDDLSKLYAQRMPAYGNVARVSA